MIFPSQVTMCDWSKFFDLRGGLANCRARFEQARCGRVAFLGGSITQSEGWRNLVMDSLRARFPETQFDFVAAGIGSLGSVPHAFRLESDVLSKGDIDLLIVEAAVNDTVNIPNDPDRMRRGMEGIVRHVRMANPLTDVIHLHFAMPEHLADYQEGRVPKAIAEHERIAEAYGNPSLHLSREVFERIRAGEFTWDRDFQDLHPSPFGHALYAAGVNRLLEAAWSGTGTMAAPHALPISPTDSASYFHGRFAPLEEARIVQGFQLVQRWIPDLPAKTRPGFVDVPALVASCPGAELRLLFHGTAAGILIASGPKTGVLDVSCDGGPLRRFETATAWSQDLYLPWTLILADDLPDAPHDLLLRLDRKYNPPAATLVICRILINGVPAFSPKLA
ncbi:MAG: GDSL-type esterase/lipase family protein [Verrucomicrobia bacterium]|nr:GDSL-type esterase/lipase family protein [Verrucomicrobiota bacterium]